MREKKEKSTHFLCSYGLRYELVCRTELKFEIHAKEKKTLLVLVDEMSVSRYFHRTLTFFQIQIFVDANRYLYRKPEYHDWIYSFGAGACNLRLLVLHYMCPNHFVSIRNNEEHKGPLKMEIEGLWSGGSMLQKNAHGYLSLHNNAICDEVYISFYVSTKCIVCFFLSFGSQTNSLAQNNTLFIANHRTRARLRSVKVHMWRVFDLPFAWTSDAICSRYWIDCFWALVKRHDLLY